MDKMIFSRPHEDTASLADLAAWINTEHGHVEQSVRDGLAHARQAGALLIQAKARIPHGSWLQWVQANCQAAPRMVQRYMRIAERWQDLAAKGGEALGLKDALRLLARRSDEQATSNATPVSYLALGPQVPAALAYYRDQGLVNEDALGQLLELAEDYGPEVLTDLSFTTPDMAGGIWGALNAIRPLEHPTLWPYIVNHHDTPGACAVAAAMQIFLGDCQARGGRVPQWEVVAFWFASTMVHFAAASTTFANRFASILHAHLCAWRESFRTALVMIEAIGEDSLEGVLEDEAYLIDEWWGFQLDLLHAGAFTAAEEMVTNPSAYPGLRKSMEAGLADWRRLGSYLLPSGMQGRLDRFVVKCDEPDVDQGAAAQEAT